MVNPSLSCAALREVSSNLSFTERLAKTNLQRLRVMEAPGGAEQELSCLPVFGCTAAQLRRELAPSNDRTDYEMRQYSCACYSGAESQERCRGGVRGGQGLEDEGRKRYPLHNFLRSLHTIILTKHCAY